MARLFISLPITVLVCLIAISTSAEAQTPAPPQASPPNQAPSEAPTETTPQKLDEAVRGKLLDQYATIAGGWYLEQRCNHFPREYKLEFDWNVAQTNIAMARHVSAAFLKQIRQSARKVAETKTCGSESRDLVVSTLVMSRDTTKFLTRQTYTLALGLAYEQQLIGLLLLAQKLDDKCKIMPGHIRTEFDDRIAEILKTFEQSIGAVGVNQTKVAAATAFDKAKPTCDEKAKLALAGAMEQARQMSPRWKAK
jgi:hypothetical protein